MRRTKKRDAKSVVKANATAYCETSSIHGFGYWVGADNKLERFCWIAIVTGFFICASFIISAAFKDWRDKPGVVVIQSFSEVTDNIDLISTTPHSANACLFQPVTKVNFPSVTLCNEHGLDSGEYVRNVFNNLEFVGDKGSKLRGEFKSILDDLTVDMEYKHVTHGGMLQKFMEEWMR